MNQLSQEADSLEKMIQQQVMDRGIRDPRLLDALRAISRERFFPKDGKADAFADRAAPIGFGQTISQPYMVALMTERLELRPTDRVLEVGTGSGYQTAILARLAAEVWTIERLKPLLDEAWERLMGMGVRNVHFRHGDGTAGWPETGPFDRVLIGAGAPALPREFLLSSLNDGGVAVLPVGGEEEQTLLKVRRQGNELVTEDICACRFVKLIGDQGWRVEPQSDTAEV